jgi:molecular chaperone GrpE
MKSILDLLLSNYFIIDEPREKIYEAETKEKKVEENTESNQDDLIKLISQIMVENEQLHDIRSELEARSSSPAALEDLFLKMITFLDGFERVLNLARQYPPSEEIDNWLKSVESVYFRLSKILEKYGLKSLDSAGKPVNLDFHDVVEYRPTFDYPSDTVIYERQKGYVFKGKLIRDAKVVVAYNPSSG